MSFESEREAFRKLQDVLGPNTIQLVDTYDPVEGTRRVAELGRPLLGIRLDSGDFLPLSKMARAIQDDAGLRDVKIMASGDLDEWRIGKLVAAGAPIDSFGVGTELATSCDAPSMGAIYKLVELAGRGTAKWSEDKASLPGVKQLYRFPDRDLLALASERCPSGRAGAPTRDFEGTMGGGDATAGSDSRARGGIAAQRRGRGRSSIRTR